MMTDLLNLCAWAAHRVFHEAVPHQGTVHVEWATDGRYWWATVFGPVAQFDINTAAVFAGG